jgi:hypothetical protein
VEDFRNAFRLNRDGSWTCIAPATLFDERRQRVQVIPGTTFCRGHRFMNVDVARWLDEHEDAAHGASVGQAGRN